ncbi:SDR family NAD(P)-dependent oxidoreductase [Priestia endophytica]|uniref:SDR family NAD(P)-dependent oxidoreductase n=1 Tax=Priestia endophytica TaxID=135735 RepID=UPI000DCA469B|nr:SDR family oxidoreductase [Priestia endophytica]RAS81882.1 hypothetical protein A4U60_13150 [Priestia endophytica]
MINPDLKGKTVLVTGANSGIGREISINFAKMGCNIILHYLENEEEAQKIIKTINEYNVKAHPIQANLVNEDELNHLYNKSIELFGSIDVLVNNAAVALFPDNIFETDANSFNSHFNVNTRATLLLINRFVKMHQEQEKKEASIINISTDASQNFPNQISYGASKAAIESYTRSIATEVGHLGITVNCISPGPVQTGYITKDLEEYVLPEIPMNRLGTPKDISDAVIFFASAQSRWITGQVLLVSGGHYI